MFCNIAISLIVRISDEFLFVPDLSESCLTQFTVILQISLEDEEVSWVENNDFLLIYSPQRDILDIYTNRILIISWPFLFTCINLS